ncbi:hypothetical protein ACVJBD_005536 [Rhizobium mongolense]
MRDPGDLTHAQRSNFKGGSIPKKPNVAVTATASNIQLANLAYDHPPGRPGDAGAKSSITREVLRIAAPERLDFRNQIEATTQYVIDAVAGAGRTMCLGSASRLKST